MSSFQTLSCCLLIILAAPKTCHGFTTTIASPPQSQHTTKLHLAEDSSYSSDNTNSNDELTTIQNPSSDLKALLPKPASRPLAMDKYGRRIYRMEDDTTVRHTKGTANGDGGFVAVTEKIVQGDRAAAAAAIPSTGTGAVGTDDSPTSSTNISTSSSSNLSSLLTDSKQLAGDKSFQSFENINSDSSTTTTTDLKSLLPTAKMRFMKLDKFGRRVQRMEDDGTVSYSRSEAGVENGGRSSEEGGNAIRGVKGGSSGGTDNDAFTSDSAIQQLQLQQQQPQLSASSTQTTTSNQQQTQQQQQQPSAIDKGQALSTLIKSPKPTPDLQKDASTTTGIHGTDLKSLLPSTKMRFMKLDKFGRRVQRMEDDGTVSYSRRSEAGGVGGENGVGGVAVDNVDGGLQEKSSSGKEEEEELPPINSPIGNLESESTIDLGTRQTSDSYVNQSGSSVNLKDLAGISKRPVFTKLDFKGGSVVDDRRMTSLSSSSSSSASLVPSQVEDVVGTAAAAPGSSALKELALSSKRPIFTKLDFKGGSVEDERRTKKKKAAPKAATSSTAATKSNLKDLLPTRPTFTKLDFKGGNVEDERRTKKKKQPQSSSPTTTTDLTKTSSSGSLQTLLPERKFMWRNQEKQRRSSTNDFIGSVGGDFLARTTTSTNSVREARQQAMRDEVIAANAASNTAETNLDNDGDTFVEDDESVSERGESYSNLTDLLPRKKFVFRDTK